METKDFWKFIGFLTLTIYSILSYGYLFLKSYYWFVLPVFRFNNLPLINYYQSVGLMCFISLFTSYIYVREMKGEYKYDIGVEIIWSMIKPWFYLFIFYLVCMFICK